MVKITPLDDRVIVRVIEQENKIGSIVVMASDVTESTLGEVLVPNSSSYHRSGELRLVVLKKGMCVRFAKRSGTDMLEAPDKEKWLCLHEHDIEYIVGEDPDGCTSTTRS